jgi:PKD repeat protein
MKRYFLHLFLLASTLLLLFPQPNLNAQITSAGKDFWFGFMSNIIESNRTYQLKVFISSEIGATGTISIPGKAWTQNFTIPANSSITIDVPTNIGHVVTSEVKETQAIHVVSDNDVNVFELNYSAQTSDGGLILPVKALGRDYYILSYAPLGSSHSEFMIAAAYDGTTVRITPSATTRGGKPANVPFDITLNRGDVYQVQSTTDLTGSSVVSIGSQFPIAVFGGAACANIPTNKAACNHLFEQMFPNNTLRRSFVTIPYKTRLNGDTYRILAINNGTNVTFNGGGTLNLNRGQFAERIITNPTFINSNFPIAVAQYSNGTFYDGVTNADPFFIMLSPVEQTREDITFQVANFVTITGNYVNISVLTSCTGSVMLDGVAVTGWSVVPGNTAYSVVQLTVAQGAHRLLSTKDCGFNAYVYGYGSADSYGYSAGVRLDTLAISLTTNTNCAGKETEFFVQSTPYTILKYNWNFGDGGTSTLAKPKHIYANGGDYTVRLIVDYDSGEKDTINSTFTIVEPKAKIAFTGGGCGNPVVNFTDQSLVVGGVISNWDWDFGDAATSTQQNPTHNYANGTYTAVLTVTTANGCISRDTITVKVFPPVLTNTKPTQELCFGSSVQIGGDVTSGSGSYVYVWSPSGGLSATNVEKPIANPTITTKYYRTITDKEGCIGKDSVQVIINPLPVINLGADVKTCFNVPIQIGATASAGTPPFDYKWIPATGLSADNIPVVMANPTSSTTYVLNITDSKGCMRSDTIDVTILPLPMPMINPAGPIDICACDSVTLDAGNLGYVKYLWSTGDSSQRIVVRKTNNYTVTVTDTNGCVNASPPVIVRVKDPYAFINLGAPSYSVEAGGLIDVPVYISKSLFLDECNSRNFIADLSFNKFIMVPGLNTPKGVFANDLRRLTLTGTRGTSDTLTVLHFMGTLGDVITSPITIENFKWTDCNTILTLDTSSVSLSNLCMEGGSPRLFRSPQTAIQLLVNPNPIPDKATIISKVIEDMPVRIMINDLNGRIGSVLFEGLQKEGERLFTHDFSKYPNGTYVITMVTPLGTEAQIVEVQK